MTLEPMPRRTGFQEAMEDTIIRMRNEGYSSKTVTNYRYAMGRVYQVLCHEGRPPRPERLTEGQVNGIRQAFAYSPHFLSTVDSVLFKMGCPYRIEYRIPMRQRVRWLERESMCQIIDAARALGPPYSTMAFLEGLMGFRRISVARALLIDFQAPLVRVRAKGTERMTNDYSLWPHKDLPSILQETMEWRQTRKHSDSPYLLPSSWTGGQLSESALNCYLKAISKESGVSPLGHHDLRRTFGRSHWKAGTPLPVIRDMLGHHSLDMTIKYLGIGADEMQVAMNRLDEYLKTPSLFLTPASPMEKT